MTDTNYLDQLLQVIDRLTMTQTTAIWQDFEDGRRATKILAAPLIQQLRQAITSSSTGHGGGSLPNQRNVLDADAMQKYDALERAILKAYKQRTAAAPYLMPEMNLRQVYISISNLYRGGQISEDALLDELSTWTRWARTIDDKLNPPPTREITAECPMDGCGKRWATGRDGETIPAIIVEYREPADITQNTLSASTATCRACGEVWRGDRRLRELAIAIDAAQTDESENYYEKSA